MATNISSSSIECDTSYDPNSEMTKYAIQFVYLTFGSILTAYMVYVIMVEKKSEYLENSYYKIFVFELITSFIMMVHDILFTRLVIYIPPLCPILGPYLNEHSLFLKISLITDNYIRSTKSVCQIFLTLNRLTCIMFPFKHRQYWSRYSRTAMILNAVLPMGVNWNVAISQAFADPAYGGFSPNYIKAVPWASLSRFQSIYYTISLIISTTNSIITLYGLKMLSHRVRAAEKTLCIATLFITIVFIVVAGFQYVWAYCAVCQIEYPSLFGFQIVSFDILNIGSPVMMLIVNKKLRSDMFSRLSVTSVHSLTTGSGVA